MTLSEPIPRADERILSPLDSFDIPRHDAQYYIKTSVGENQDPDVVAKAQQIHGISYVDYQYFNEEGKEKDGRLVPELDGTRGTVGGERIANYLLAARKGSLISEASATVRLLDIGSNGSIEDLPTYKYFAGTFEDDVKEKLNGIITTKGKGSIREIAALATTDVGEHRGSFELMRAMIQNSMIKEMNYGQPELYIASLTDKSFRPVVEFIDRESVELLAEPVQIFSDDPRSRSIYVTPVLMDLTAVLRNTVDAIKKASTPSLRAKLHNKLVFLTDGLSADVIDRYINGLDAA